MDEVDRNDKKLILYGAHGLQLDFSGDVDLTRIQIIESDSNISESDPYVVYVYKDYHSTPINGIDTEGNLISIEKHFIRYNGTQWTDLGILGNNDVSECIKQQIMI